MLKGNSHDRSIIVLRHSQLSDERCECEVRGCGGEAAFFLFGLRLLKHPSVTMGGYFSVAIKLEHVGEKHRYSCAAFCSLFEAEGRVHCKMRVQQSFLCEHFIAFPKGPPYMAFLSLASSLQKVHFGPQDVNETQWDPSVALPQIADGRCAMRCGRTAAKGSSTPLGMGQRQPVARKLLRKLLKGNKCFPFIPLTEGNVVSPDHLFGTCDWHSFQPQGIRLQTCRSHVYHKEK